MNFELDIDRMAAGGDGLGAAPDGRVVFVPGGLPGDRLAVQSTVEKKQFIRAEIRHIVVSADGRVEPPCPHVAEGCGGCDWQHASPGLQTDLRVAIVQDSLRRLGKLDGIDVRPGPPLAPVGYRTTVRCVVEGGRAGFRQERSHAAVRPDPCLVAHPRVQEIMAASRFPAVDEVTIRVGARTGEAMVQFGEELPSSDRPEIPAGVLAGTPANPAWIHEEVAGRRFRVSGPSFFQCRPDGAEAMISLVAEAIDGVDGPLVDAYAGVGLFGAALGHGRAVTAVEVSPSSVADASHNLPDHAVIVESTVEDWQPTPAAAVVADPARRGLGVEGVAAVAGTGADVIALVSCDPASLGRDARLLVDAGYELTWVRTLDLFGHTSHIEAVSRFVRADLS